MRQVALLTAALVFAASQGQAADFHDWAAVVVSGDDRAAHDDTPTQAFDNARHEIVRLLERRGFRPENLAQFSVQAEREHVGVSESRSILKRMEALAKSAPGGCLLYVTSHGSPREIVVGESEFKPGALARGLRAACGNRPTAIVLSACFSGSFTPALQGPNRFVLTAARKDRSSFGCGESDRYPYFDGCIIEALPTAPDLTALGERARACVSRREKEEDVGPPSEPQLSIGADFQREAPVFTPNAGRGS